MWVFLVLLAVLVLLLAGQAPLLRVQVLCQHARLLLVC